MDIVKKSFYLTSLFSDAVPDSRWSANEKKTALTLFYYLDPYKIYLPDLDEDININELLEHIPLEYEIAKADWIELTGIDKENFSREIKAVRLGLSKKTFNTPHATDSHKDSGESIPWFSKITYSAKEAKLKFKINSDALENLVSFVKYTKIDFEYIKPLKSGYSIYTYIFLKIIKDISQKKNKTTETIKIDELKNKLGLSGKYKLIKMFQERVLDVVKNEINEFTDLTFDYDLDKDGSRSYQYIHLHFDYKKPKIIEMPLPKKDNEFFEFDESMYENQEQSDFESILFSWSLRAKQITLVESVYSPLAIENAIKVTEEAFNIGKIINTRAAFFMGVLQNTQQKEDEQNDMSENKKKNQIELNEKIVREKEVKEKEKIFNHIISLINDYDEEFKKVLSALSFGMSSLESIKLSDDFREKINSLSIFDAEMFKGYSPSYKVFDDGYYNQELARLANPDMYTFLSKISKIIKPI